MMLFLKQVFAGRTRSEGFLRVNRIGVNRKGDPFANLINFKFFYYYYQIYGYLI